MIGTNERGAATPELTLKSVVLGLALALVFGAANAYLGMKAGQTVAATIPAAVIAVAVFRLPGLRGGVLEQNIARTAASVGEALVAGAVFTLPAFLLAEVDGRRLWPDLRGHYLEGSLVLLAGGLIGVFFIIALRRALCVEADLPWPESVACANLVRATTSEASAGEAPRYVLSGMGLGAVLQLLKSDKGVPLLREYLEGWIAFPKAVVHHFNFERKGIGDISHFGGLAWVTPALSPALIGIGAIIGPRYAFLNLAGGLLAWWVFIPLLLFFDPDLGRRLAGGAGNEPEAAVLANTVWFNIVRPIAVGMMMVSTVWTLIGLRGPILDSFRGVFGGLQRGQAAASETERDIDGRFIAAGIAVLSVAIGWLYWHFTGSMSAAIGATVAMVTAGFLLSAVGGYLVGLAGSSNQPLSGLTLTALILAAGLLLSFGVTGASGVAAVLGVAAVVSCAVSVSGSLVQDLKVGHLLGGTPWRMQVVDIAAVVMLSFFLMAPVILLHEANLATGGIGGRALPAPQAGLMAQLARGIVGGEMAWGLLAMGAAFGLALILCGARSPMMVAVGMYLPFETSAAVALGGAMQYCGALLAGRVRVDGARARAEDRLTLIASGLVAGEAILGIVLAGTFLAGAPALAGVFGLDGVVRMAGGWSAWLSLAGFAVLGWALIGAPVKGLRDN